MTAVLAVYNSRGCVVRLSQGSVGWHADAPWKCGVGFRHTRERAVAHVRGSYVPILLQKLNGFPRK